MSNDGGSVDFRMMRDLQQNAWQQGKSLRVEALLQQFPDHHLANDDILKLIRNEFQVRTKLAEKPELAEYIGRFPLLAESLRRILASFTVPERGPLESTSIVPNVAVPEDPAMQATQLFREADAKRPVTSDAEKNLLFAFLAFEADLLDLQQLLAVCRAWTANKSEWLAEGILQRGWVSADDREFLDKQVERKLAKHEHDPRGTLNAIVRGDVWLAAKVMQQIILTR